MNTTIKTSNNKKLKSKSNIKHKLNTSMRRLWTDDEDNAITKLINKYGIKKWALISKKMEEEYNIYGRSGKQCRERYY